MEFNIKGKMEGEIVRTMIDVLALPEVTNKELDSTLRLANTMYRLLSISPKIPGVSSAMRNALSK
eukprot:11044201-Ditylum_brightwellii.AAC.1